MTAFHGRFFVSFLCYNTVYEFFDTKRAPTLGLRAFFVYHANEEGSLKMNFQIKKGRSKG